MWKRMIVMLVLVLLFIVGIAYWKFIQIKAAIAMGAKFAPPPAAVTTTRVKAVVWEPVLNAVGTLKAVNGVVVSTDLAGVVSKIAFESGVDVKKGDLLVKLDTRQEEAQLRSADAKWDLTKANLDRQRSLVSKNVAAQSDFDTASSESRQAAAAVEDAKALIARKTILAPFDGLLGIRMVNVGQYLNVGASIVPLQSLDPIYVEFAVPQQHIDQIAVGKKLRFTVSGIAGQAFEGEVTAIDSRVDESTRNITVQGTAPNPDRKLRPGMFANVEVILPEKKGVVVVPASSINYAPYGDSVYVVTDGRLPDGKPAKVVQQHVVKLGATRGNQVSITSGLEEGEEVVTSGVFKLRGGAPVQINNSVQPGDEASPKPPET